MKNKKKTRKAVAKRIKISKNSGNVKRKKANMSHLALGKSKKQKRQLKKSTKLSKSDYGRWKKIIN